MSGKTSDLKSSAGQGTSLPVFPKERSIFALEVICGRRLGFALADNVRALAWSEPLTVTSQEQTTAFIPKGHAHT